MSRLCQCADSPLALSGGGITGSITRRARATVATASATGTGTASETGSMKDTPAGARQLEVPHMLSESLQVAAVRGLAAPAQASLGGSTAPTRSRAARDSESDGGPGPLYAGPGRGLSVPAGTGFAHTDAPWAPFAMVVASGAWEREIPLQVECVIIAVMDVPPVPGEAAISHFGTPAASHAGAAGPLLAAGTAPLSTPQRLSDLERLRASGTLGWEWLLALDARANRLCLTRRNRTSLGLCACNAPECSCAMDPAILVAAASGLTAFSKCTVCVRNQWCVPTLEHPPTSPNPGARYLGLAGSTFTV
jgi:hypothetical protein